MKAVLFAIASCCLLLLSSCAGQVLPESTGSTSESLDVHPPPPLPPCASNPGPRVYVITNGVVTPGNPECAWNPGHYFSGQPVYNFIKHPTITVTPAFVPCGPVISDLEEQCYQTSLAGLMSCQNTSTNGQTYCQNVANQCLSTLENGCLNVQNMCDQSAYNDCNLQGVLQMNCYAELEGDCEATANACAADAPSCDNYELSCEQAVNGQVVSCQAGVYVQYQACVGSLGTCI